MAPESQRDGMGRREKDKKTDFSLDYSLVVIFLNYKCPYKVEKIKYLDPSILVPSWL